MGLVDGWNFFTAIDTLFIFVRNVYNSMPDNLQYIIFYSFGVVIVVSVILMLGGGKS